MVIQVACNNILTDVVFGKYPHLLTRLYFYIHTDSVNILMNLPSAAFDVNNKLYKEKKKSTITFVRLHGSYISKKNYFKTFSERE